MKYTKAMKKKHACCCVLLAIVVILGALALAFYLLYRPLSPRVVATLVDLSIDEFSLEPPVLKLSVGVHVVVSNPSRAPYRYRETMAAVTYHGEPVGVTVVPAGEVGGRATARIEPLTEVDGVKLVESRYFAADAVAGELPFVVVTKVDGKALVLHTFEVSVTVEVVCYVRLYVFHGESSSRCVSSVRTGTTGSSGRA